MALVAVKAGRGKITPNFAANRAAAEEFAERQNNLTLT
jgi:hypothetical protein